jgi:hypothetical protein
VDVTAQVYTADGLVEALEAFFNVAHKEPG